MIINKKSTNILFEIFCVRAVKQKHPQTHRGAHNNEWDKTVALCANANGIFASTISATRSKGRGEGAVKLLESGMLNAAARKERKQVLCVPRKKAVGILTAVS